MNMPLAIAAPARAPRPDAPRIDPADAHRPRPGAMGWDRAGVAWAHPDPRHLARWLAGRDSLLRTVEAATRRARRPAARQGG